MIPIKYIKILKNEFNYDVMTLVNIVSHKNQLVYFFIAEYIVTHNGITTIEKDLIEVDDVDFSEIIFTTYKIA